MERVRRRCYELNRTWQEAKIILHPSRVPARQSPAAARRRKLHTSPRELCSRLEATTEAMVATTSAASEIESPSDDKTALDRMAQFAAGRFANLGGRVTVHPQASAGDHLQVN